MKSLYVVLFIASIAANIPHASGQVGTQINIDKLLGHEEGLNNEWGEHLPRSSELDAVLIRFYVAMRPGHTGLASAVCIASKRPPSASI